jgi:hypothetical protein
MDLFSCVSAPCACKLHTHNTQKHWYIRQKHTFCWSHKRTHTHTHAHTLVMTLPCCVDTWLYDDAKRISLMIFVSCSWADAGYRHFAFMIKGLSEYSTHEISCVWLFIHAYSYAYSHTHSDVCVHWLFVHLCMFILTIVLSWINAIATKVFFLSSACTGTQAHITGTIMDWSCFSLCTFRGSGARAEGSRNTHVSPTWKVGIDACVHMVNAWIHVHL